MASGKLYTYPENFRAFKAQIAAQYSGAALEVPSDFKLGETNATDSFLSKFPAGKVPAFESTDGTCVFESNAIANFVGNDQTNGADAVARAQVLQWVNYADSEILPAACTWVFPCLGLSQYNKQNTERAKVEVKKVLGVLNKHLSTRTFLVGERVTLADISVVCNLLSLYKMVLEPSFRSEFGNVNRWFITCINQPQFKTVLGEVKLCEKMAQFDAKKYQELQGKGDSKKAKKDDKKSEKKAEKADKKPAPEAAAEPPAPKKPKDPLALLPKGTFDMDGFKKSYSNEPLETSIPHLWEHFDAEHYSIWSCKYKFREQLNMTFMSKNLINGFFQRIEGMRKCGFASLFIVGSERYNHDIMGIFMWPGQELAFPLSDDWTVDYESYDWRKLDVTNADDKEYVRKCLAWEGFDKEVADGDIFK